MSFHFILLLLYLSFALFYFYFLRIFFCFAIIWGLLAMSSWLIFSKTFTNLISTLSVTLDFEYLLMWNKSDTSTMSYNPKWGGVKKWIGIISLSLWLIIYHDGCACFDRATFGVMSGHWMCQRRLNCFYFSWGCYSSDFCIYDYSSFLQNPR